MSERVPAKAIQLSGGRRLAWAEYGAPDGVPLIFMHGLPSSRLAGAMFHDAAGRRGVRIIAPDRPGFGQSDPDPDRRIVDWPADIRALADSLSIDRFALLGTSSGFPYALACAVALPDRTERLLIFSGLGRLDVDGVMTGLHPQSRTMYTLALRSPRLASLWMHAYAKAVRDSPERVVQHQIRTAPSPDRATLREPAHRELRVADLLEAFRQGPGAAGLEARAHVADWGFSGADLRSDLPVDLWQGMLDRSHPSAMGRAIAATLPGSRTRFVEGAGALGFLAELDDLFARMLPPRARPAAAQTGPIGAGQAAGD